MKHLYLLIGCCCIIFNLYAQPKVPVGFKNQQPKWQHYSYDPNRPRFLQLHEQIDKPLVIGKDAYLLHSILNNEQEGYLVEKIDLETGQIKWRDSYYDTKLNTRRYPGALTPKGDKIEMYYFQELEKEKPIWSWQNSRFNRIDYCADSGKKCDSLITDLKDTLNTNLMMPYLNLAYFTQRSFLYTYHNKVRYFSHNQIYDKVTKKSYVAFKLLTLDNLGHKLDSTYTRFDTKNQYPIFTISLKEYEKEKYVCLVHARKDVSANPNKEVILIYFDKDFKIEKTVDLTPLMPTAVISDIAYIDSNNILLSSLVTITKNGKPYYKTSGTLLKSSSGELVDRVTFDNYEFSDENDDNYAMTYLPKTKQIVLINTIRRPTTKTFDMEILASKGNGKFDLLKTIPINNTGDMGIYNVTAIGDSSLLCRYKYVDPTSRTDYNVAVKWSIWAMFPMASLGFITPTNEVATLNNIKIFPNPAHDQLNINILENQEMLDLSAFDYQGRLVYQSDLQTTTQINTSEWPKGLCAIVIRNKKGKLQHTSKVIIE